MKKKTQAEILKVLGSIVFVSGVLLSGNWLLLPEQFKAMDLYFLGLWLYIGAISIQTAGD